MYKNHLEIAKLFRHNSDTNEYFYHLQASWYLKIDDKEKITLDEWVCVSKEVFDLLRRSAWVEYAHERRDSRCLKADGTRCKDNCKECAYTRSGLPLTLNQLLEDGLQIAGDCNIEKHVEHRELMTALHKAIDDLEEMDQEIVTMWANGFSEREIARRIGMSQRGVGYRRKKLIKKLAEALKDFR